MKATERCSCGGSFEAEGRGAKAALLEWRATHQHASTPYFHPMPISPTTAPWEPPWYRVTSGGTTTISHDDRYTATARQISLGAAA